MQSCWLPVPPRNMFCVLELRIHSWSTTPLNQDFMLCQNDWLKPLPPGFAFPTPAFCPVFPLSSDFSSPLWCHIFMEHLPPGHCSFSINPPLLRPMMLLLPSDQQRTTPTLSTRGQFSLSGYTLPISLFFV